MHLDTGFCNVSSAATEWHGTTQNMSFRPEIVDLACSLCQNKKWFQGHKLVHLMHPILIFTMGQVRQQNGVKQPEIQIFATGQVRQRNGAKPSKTLVLGRK